MDPELVEEIAETIYRKFPEVDGVKPKVRKQPVPQDAPRSAHANPKYLLTFNTKYSTHKSFKILFVQTPTPPCL